MRLRSEFQPQRVAPPSRMSSCLIWYLVPSVHTSDSDHWVARYAAPVDDVTRQFYLVAHAKYLAHLIAMIDVNRATLLAAARGDPSRESSNRERGVHTIGEHSCIRLHRFSCGKTIVCLLLCINSIRLFSFSYPHRICSVFVGTVGFISLMNETTTTRPAMRR